MNIKIRNSIIFILMLVSAAMAEGLRPRYRTADHGPKINLEIMIPHEFGDWREEQQPSALIIDPKTQELIDSVYTQTLTRTYVRSSGERVMLSIAYGADQSDSLQLHLPEGCYGGQGFAIGEMIKGNLKTDLGEIPVTRLVAIKGPRIEPITYWTMTAGKVENSPWERKKANLAYTLAGKIPDGVLFRMSSITSDSSVAFDLHRLFANSLLNNITSENRKRLIGVEGG